MIHPPNATPGPPQSRHTTICDITVDLIAVDDNNCIFHGASSARSPAIAASKAYRSKRIRASAEIARSPPSPRNGVAPTERGPSSTFQRAPARRLRPRVTIGRYGKCEWYIPRDGRSESEAQALERSLAFVTRAHGAAARTDRPGDLPLRR